MADADNERVFAVYGNASKLNSGGELSLLFTHCVLAVYSLSLWRCRNSCSPTMQFDVVDAHCRGMCIVRCAAWMLRHIRDHLSYWNRH